MKMQALPALGVQWQEKKKLKSFFIRAFVGALIERKGK